MKKSEISKTFYQRLICKLYVLGAPSEGESILFEVYGDEQVIYSCITDSFTMDNNNVPISITEQHGIDHVTDVFWTHPHDDHSDGLIEIIDKYKPEYRFLLGTKGIEITNLSVFYFLLNLHSIHAQCVLHPLSVE